MNVLFRVLLIAGSLVVSTSVLADSELPAGARAEIERLLSGLSASGCEFFRNGSWHGAADAAAHLRMKYDYLDGKGRLHSAEEFIALAGTESSQSGKPYQVRCKDAPAIASADWLKARLAQIRRP